MSLRSGCVDNEGSCAASVRSFSSISRLVVIDPFQHRWILIQVGVCLLYSREMDCSGHPAMPRSGKERLGKPSRLPPDRRRRLLVQAAALPWRVGDSGDIEILLVTSKAGKRWIVPKGWPMIGRSLPKAAEQEAFE